MGAKKVYFPKIRLAELVAAPGGVTREDAVASAVQNVQAISGEGDAVMTASIQQIEKIAAGANGCLEAAALKTILTHADQVITLAGTFGYDSLDRSVRSLCDTIEGLLDAKLSDAAPVTVHVDAMRLFMPGKETAKGAAAEAILAELARVQAHVRGRA